MDKIVHIQKTQKNQENLETCENQQIQQVKQLIQTINQIHLDFSHDYFETQKLEKINLSKTIKHVPAKHIYRYRLTLHESINDYLMRAETVAIKYFYRVKTRESIDETIQRFSFTSHENQYPDQYLVNNWLNDIFGARVILNKSAIHQIIELLDAWQEEYGLKNWYLRETPEYKGLHIYFKNKNNFYFPWELQIWDEQDMENNITSHEKFKRCFNNGF